MVLPSSLEKPLLTLKEKVIALSDRRAVTFILFGSAATSGTAKDVDVAIIVNDRTDLFEFVRLISPAVVEQTMLSGRLVTCFPITEKNYARTASQFVANVKAHGLEF
jgi:predicted nucleotidyltransferase